MKEAEKVAVSESTQYSTRGKTFVGVVVSAKANKTASVQWERRIFVKKYERYEKRRSKVAAHIPDHLEIKEGDTVRIAETRPISKTKHFVITEKMEEIQ